MYKILFEYFCGPVRIEGLGKMPYEPAIYVANHQSYFDIPIFFMLPMRIIITSKSLVKYVPGPGTMTSMMGTIFISRGNKESRDNFFMEAHQKLNDRKSIHIYPQGKRKVNFINENSHNPLKKGAFYLAKQSGVPIVPYTIIYPEDFNRSKKGVLVKIHDPIDTTKFEIDELVDITTKKIFTSFY